MRLKFPGQDGVFLHDSQRRLFFDAVETSFFAGGGSDVMAFFCFGHKKVWEDVMVVENSIQTTYQKTLSDIS